MNSEVGMRSSVTSIPKGTRTQRIGSLYRGYRGIYRDLWGLYKGPRTKRIGLQVPNTIPITVFGP